MVPLDTSYREIVRRFIPRPPVTKAVRVMRDQLHNVAKNLHANFYSVEGETVIFLITKNADEEQRVVAQFGDWIILDREYRVVTDAEFLDSFMPMERINND